MTSSLSMLMLVASANTCRFVWLAAIPDAFVEVIDTSETGQEELTETFFDAFCDGHLMNIHDDFMWMLVKIFHIAAIALAAAAAFLAMMVHFVSPKLRLLFWQFLSVSSALCALMSVPVFLLFETEPCNDFPEQQSCSFGLASYIHVGAIVFAVVSTICTQCFDPPKKTSNRGQSKRNNSSYSPDSNKKPNSGRYWLPLQSEKEEISDSSVNLDDDILEKGAVVTTSTEDEDEEDDRAQSDAGVIGITESQEQSVRLLPQNLSYENFGGGQDKLEQETVGVDLRGPAVVYESLEREAPTLESPSLAPTDEISLPTQRGSPKVDLTKLPSLVDDDEEQEKGGASDEGADDLGSLEPTVVVVSGAESVLDSVDSPPECRPDDPIKDKNIKGNDQVELHDSPPSTQKRKVLPLHLSKLIGPRRRNGYRLMDDTELESSLPMSPPLEIITMNMINSSLDFDDFEDLYENEHKGLDEQLHQPQLVESKNGDDALPDDDALDPELLWNDDDDFVGLVSSTHNQDFEVCDVDSPMDAGSPALARPSCSLKRRRNRRWNAGMSLASANSLLSYTIAEETASDLVETDDDNTQNAFDPYGTASLVDPIPLTKSRSAPNLSRFDKPFKKDGWVVDDLHLTGVNDYKKKAQVFSSAESSSLVSARRSTGGLKKAAAPKGFEPGSSSSLPDLLRSGGKRLSTFRDEKLLREGIHATTSNISDTSSIDDGLKSLTAKQSKPSRSARDARIRRLQNTSSPIRSRPDPINVKPSVGHGATATPVYLSRPPRPPPSPAIVSPFSSPIAKLLYAESPESLGGNLEYYDTRFDSGLTLDIMDASLAELTSDLEPDEMSV